MSIELVRVLYGIQENRGAVFIKALVLWWVELMHLNKVVAPGAVPQQ